MKYSLLLIPNTDSPATNAVKCEVQSLALSLLAAGCYILRMVYVINSTVT